LAEKKIADDYSFLSDRQLALLDSYGVEPGKYILYVSRLEPENNADKVIAAFVKLPKELRQNYPLVIVGDAPYALGFKEYIKSMATEEVLFLGYRFSEEYEVLQLATYLYIQATEVGGTHPALVEAMGYANYILANEVLEHIETIRGSGEYYRFNDVEELSQKIKQAIEKPLIRLEFKRDAFQRSVEFFSWEAVTAKYVALIESVISGG